MLAFVLLACFGCKKENDKDEYYVQYEVITSTINNATQLHVFINAEDTNLYTVINPRSPYIARIGPVKKGFKAWIGVSNDDLADSALRLAAQISVSKNNGPFELKKVDENNAPRETWSASYTIDF
jgi:hypothetical protein